MEDARRWIHGASRCLGRRRFGADGVEGEM